MPRLDRFLEWAESHRITVCAIAAVLIAIIAWADAQLRDVTIGYLYLIPILLSAATLNGVQIVVLAAICSFFREAFDPLQWSAGAGGRMLTALAGFSMAGFFAAELNQRRRLLTNHLQEVQSQVRLRMDAEQQLRSLIETSPLAILTIDHSGRVLLANESVREMLNFKQGDLHGTDITPHLPILPRMLQSNPTAGYMRTNVECKAKRRDGEVFLAHVWLSTYRMSEGTGLAAVIWDASENLRDREGAGLDTMLATSRILVGALSHEIRNLASAAAASYAGIAATPGVAANRQYEALGSLIHALERIATSGLQLAAQRERAITDLGTVLDETRIVVEPFLRDADIEIAWELNEDLPLVQGDHHSLLQVFVNLARNIKAALENCPTRKLRVIAGVERDLAVVRLYDSGPGVAHPENLFKPFQPGAHSAGLGLYVSQAILRSYGGSLRYEPQPAGSCFIVELWPEEKPVPNDSKRSTTSSGLAGR
ncbi:MAG TPA: PAS domain-containing protein [Bryobacteraceae bacterium]|jgi:PAS domain S-box-containing protein